MYRVRVVLAAQMVVNGLVCSSFVDITNALCTVSSNVVDVYGGFSAGNNTFTISGFTTPSSNTSLTYTSVTSYDYSNYTIDSDSSTIIFTHLCTLPCKSCTSSTSTSVCLSCYTSTSISNYIYYYNNQCQNSTSCPTSTYPSIITYTCALCDSQCLTCVNQSYRCTSCSSTSSYKYLHIVAYTCLQTCPSYYYANTSLLTCQLCVSPCSTCSNYTYCYTCITNRYLYLGECLSECPSALTVNNNSTFTCDVCDSSCKNCSGIYTNCTGCHTGKFLYHGQCVEECLGGLVPYDGVCVVCDTNCLTCINEPTYCLTCNTSSSYPYLYSISHTCLSSCPALYFSNISICTLCSTISSLHCVNCSSMFSCYSCDSSYILYKSRCIDYVPYGHVNVSGVAEECEDDCLTCTTSTTTCTSCITYNLYVNTCVQVCPNYYTPNANRTCIPCLSPCLTCSSSPTTCTSCITSTTPSVYLTNNLCLQSCPNGTYPNNNTYKCTVCPLPCLSCTSVSNCSACTINYSVSDGECVGGCGDGYVAVYGQCRTCTTGCDTCIQTVYKCLSCSTGLYLLQINSSCVSDCGFGLYANATSNKCTACSQQCRTCSSTPTSCLSCAIGILYNHQCVSQCPSGYFNLLSVCKECANNCIDCSDGSHCLQCSSTTYLYNGYCVSQCPSTAAVVSQPNVCTKCSVLMCYQCTPQDVCTSCSNPYLLLIEGGTESSCVGQCPSAYTNNGTHCLDINQMILTSSAVVFPVPFSIGAVVVFIACLMSRLQYDRTYLAGAVFAIFGLLEAGALGYWLYLAYGQVGQIVWYVGVGALGFLALLNVLALIFQNIVFCNDKQFKSWYRFPPCKFTTFLVNLLSLCISHKFRNILFCKLFTFTILSAQLQTVSKFKIFNIFSFASLVFSAASIFVGAMSLQSADKNTQIYYACIDVIAVVGAGAVLAFFNAVKGNDYFYQMTPEGFQLKRTIRREQQYEHRKACINQIQVQDEIYTSSKISNYANSAQKSHIVGRKPVTAKVSTIYSGSESYSSLAEPMMKQYEEASVQALQIIDDTQFKTKDVSQQQMETIPKLSEDNSNYTVFWQREDKSVGQSLKKGEDAGIQNTISYEPSMKSQGIQPSFKMQKVQQSKQEEQIDQSETEGKQDEVFDNHVDRSVQRTVFYKQDQSAQYGNSLKSAFSKKKPEMKSIQIQKSTIQKKDQKFGTNSERVIFDEYAQDVGPEKTDEVLYQNSTNKDSSKKELAQQEKDELLLPKQSIKQYEEDLQQRIRDKQRELRSIRRKIDIQQKLNQQKSKRLDERPKFQDNISKQLKSEDVQIQNDHIQQQKVQAKNYLPSKVLKKQPDLAQEQIDEIDGRTLQQIQIVDDEQQNKNVIVEFNDEQSKVTQQQFLGMLEHDKNKVIFQSSLEIDKSKQIQQQKGQPIRISEPQYPQQPKKQSYEYIEEDGQISEGKDNSTKVVSLAQPLNRRKLHPKSSKDQKTQIQALNQSQQYEQKINNMPLDTYDQILTGYDGAASTGQIPHQRRKNNQKKIVNQSVSVGKRTRNKIPSHDQQGKTKYNKFKKAQKSQNSTFLQSGKSQFTQQGIAKKHVKKDSPLKMRKQWEESKDSNKNFTQSDFQTVQNVKNKQNKRSHLRNPIETDIDTMQFQQSKITGTEQLNEKVKQNSQKNSENLISEQVNPITGQVADDQSIEKAKLDLGDSQQDFQQIHTHQKQQREEYPDSSIHYFNRNMIFDQMLDRPDNGGLENYFHKQNQKREKRSKEKTKKNYSFNQLPTKTQRIYKQRFN